jgi:histidyl-tRNA synthetase
MARFRFIEGLFRDSCLKWGYQEVKTPTLEYLHLFTSTGTLTPAMLGRVYSFLDWDGWSGERVVLRPEGTIPIARFYVDRMQDKGQARLFYVSNAFVFEETGKHSREKWQCGVESIGSGDALADAELVMLAGEVLAGLGVGELKLKLSHAGLVRAILEELDLSPKEQEEIFDRILDGDSRALGRLKPKNAELKMALGSLFKLKGKSSGFLKNLKVQASSSLPLGKALDDFISVVDQLESLGCDYQIDITSGRGFEYYTGIIFQFFSGREKIGGGGRYDNLIPLMGGRQVPASGFALYLDRLMNMLKPETLTKVERPKILVKLESNQSGAVSEGFDIASRLRRGGYIAQIGLGGETKTRWVLEMKSKAPRFILTDGINGKTFEAQNWDKILKILDEESGDKGSTA